MKTLRANKKGAAKRCQELGVEVGDKVSIRNKGPMVITAIGMSSVLAKPRQGNEVQIQDPIDIREAYVTVSMSIEGIELNQPV